MKKLMDKLVLACFPFFLKVKGYQVVRAVSARHIEDALAIKNEVYINELKWIYPEECHDWIERNNEKSIKFVAYHKNEPMGTIALFDPNRANRLYDSCGINENCEFSEVGSLAVKKAYRERQMFVFILLFYALYNYSRKNAIEKWIAISAKAIYWNCKRFAKGIELVKVSTSQGKDPMGIIYREAANRLNPTAVCFTADISSISPGNIVRDLIGSILQKQSRRKSKIFQSKLNWIGKSLGWW